MKTINRKPFFVKPQGNRSGKKRTPKNVAGRAAALGLGLALCIGMALTGESRSRAQESERQALETQIRERLRNDMAEAAGYLRKLDESIAQNQEKLEEVNGQLEGRQDALLKVETTQKKLTENAADVSVRVSEMEKQTVTQILDLQENMQSVRNEILRAVDEMASALRAMEAGERDSLQNQEALLAQIEKVNSDVREIGEAADALKGDLYQAHDGLNGLIDALEARGVKGNEEMLTALSAAEEKLQTAMGSEMEQLSGKLEETGELVNGNLELFRLAVEEDFEVLEAAAEESFRSLQADADEKFDAVQMTADRNFTALQTKADENFNAIQASSLENFTAIQTAAGEHFNTIRTSSDANFRDLREASERNFSAIRAVAGENFSAIQETAGRNFESLNRTLGEMLSSFDENLTSLEQAVSQDISGLSAQSGAGMKELKEYLLQLQGMIGQRLDQVFTSVSNGKKMLASALLTKGISEAEDASFSEIMDAVLRIPQKIVIGQAQLPGTAVYRYHYHVNGSGGNPHTERQSAPGGCYTVPLRHVHSEEAGCYGVEAYHAHNDACSGHWSRTNQGAEDAKEQENVEGKKDAEGSVWVYDCGNLPLNASRTVLTCGLGTDHVEGYGVSCSLFDGQLIGATYTYDGSLAAPAAEAVPEGTAGAEETVRALPAAGAARPSNAGAAGAEQASNTGTGRLSAESGDAAASSESERETLPQSSSPAGAEQSSETGAGKPSPMPGGETQSAGSGAGTSSASGETAPGTETGINGPANPSSPAGAEQSSEAESKESAQSSSPAEEERPSDVTTAETQPSPSSGTEAPPEQGEAPGQF